MLSHPTLKPSERPALLYKLYEVATLQHNEEKQLSYLLQVWQETKHKKVAALVIELLLQKQQYKKAFNFAKDEFCSSDNYSFMLNQINRPLCEQQLENIQQLMKEYQKRLKNG